MTALVTIMQALADQIQDTLSGTADPLIENLQVTSTLNIDPTPPSVDIYPADPFQEALAYGKANNDFKLAVRARVSSSDHQAGQLLLLSMMDTGSTTSLAKAITEDRTLGGTVGSLAVEGPSGYGVFIDAGGVGSLLGCRWTVRIIP